MTKKPKNIMTVDAKLPGLKLEGFIGKSYLRKEIEPLLGLTGRSIQYYGDINLIVPEADNRPGKGKKRRYSTRNIFELLLIQRLIKFGFKLSNLRELISAASALWMKNTELNVLTICNHKDLSKFVVNLYDENHIDLKIDLNGLDSILIIDISNIIEKIRTI